ncbi:glycosyltransferase [Actinopolymorpha singaporensis]
MTANPASDARPVGTHTGAVRRPRAVHVSTVHAATDIRIFHKQCRTLAAAGYDVVLYARTDHLQDPRADRPYEQDGVRVVPVPPPSGRAARMTVGVWRLFRPLLAQAADVYHFHDPELVPLATALRLCGRNVVFDAHEPLPAQILAKPWIPPRLRPVVAGATRLLVRLAGQGVTVVVAASPLVESVYAGARRMVVVNNFPILPGDDPTAGPAGGQDNAECPPEIPYDRRPRGIVYVGGLSDLRGLSAMLDVARIAGTRHGERLTLIGAFVPPELEARLAEPELAGLIDYVGVQPPKRVRELLGESRVGLILQVGPEAYKWNLPTKMFEYMAEGLPVVASHFPLWKQILDEAEAGVTVDPQDGQAAAEAVSRLLSDPVEAAAMGRRGRKAVYERYSFGPEAAKLLALYDSLLPGDVRAAGTR